MANSQYATVREEKGICYLYMKTIERAAFPARMWERVKLPRNYEQALAKIDEHLIYWPRLQRHRSKQRLTRIHHVLARMRKIRTKRQKKLVPINRKYDKREEKKEEKALIAARIEKEISTELLERLQKDLYSDTRILNYPNHIFKEALGVVDDGEEEEEEQEFEEEEEEEDEDEGETEYVDGSDFEESDDDMEDMYDSFSDDDYEDEDEAALQKKKLKRRQLEVEYEEEGTSAKVQRKQKN